MTRRLLRVLAVTAVAAFAVGNAHASVTTKSGTGATVLNGKIAFDSSRSPGDSSLHAVYSINADGSGLSELTPLVTPGCSSCGNSGDPAYSPDGTRIVFNTGLFSGGDHCCETLGMMNADGSDKHLLIKGDTTLCGNNQAAAWSPDGTQIVFVSCNNGFATLDVVNADGSGFHILKQFLNSALEVLHPSWSPDGSRIAYMRLVGNGQFDIFTTSAVDGSGETDLGLGDEPEYSPDGTRIVFDLPRGGNDTGLWMMNADGSNRVHITATLDYEPSWSPDGTRIVFGSQRTGNALIWTANPDGSDAIPVTSASDGVDINPSWQNGGASSGGGDTTPPVATILLPPPTGQNGWYTGPVVAQVSATDAGGVASVDCSPLVLSASLQVTVDQQGTTNVVCTATDTAGNSATATAQIRLDSVNPTLAPTLSETTIVAGDHLTADPGATDATSGIASASCDPVDTSFAGGHSVRCTATDNAGNTSALALFFFVDPAPDTTPPSLELLSVGTGWARTPVAVTVDATDDGGIASVNCSPIAVTMTGLGTTAATGSLVDDREGITDITCIATDIAGNSSIPESTEIRVDTVKPTLSPTLSETTIVVGDHVTADPGAADATSGIATASCGAVDTSAAGHFTVSCTATDNAGNSVIAETFYTVASAPDTTPPTVTIAALGAGQNGWFSGQPAIEVTATDPGGSVALIACDPFIPTFTDLNTPTAKASLTVTAQGVTEITCTAFDAAGNQSAPATYEVKIDSVKPTLAPTLSASTVLLHANVVATPHAADATSGVATQSCGAVSTDAVGVFTVTCTATDSAGNKAIASFTYLVQYNVTFVMPVPTMTLHAGLPIPIALRLADVHNVAIPDAEASALAGQACKVKLAGAGVQTFSACATYVPLLNVFASVWLTHATPKGAVTLTATITYPGGQQIATKEQLTLH